MAASSRNKTILTLGIVGVIIFLAWKLWPAISKKIGAGSGGSAGPVGSDMGANQFGYPQGQQPQGSGLTLGGSSGAGGGGSSGGAGGGSFTAWLNSILNQGYTNANALGDVGYDQTQIQANNDFLDSLSQVPTQNLNDLPSYSYDDPNAPWNNDGSDAANYAADSDAYDYLYGGDSSGDGGGADQSYEPDYGSEDGGDGGGDSGD